MTTEEVAPWKREEVKDLKETIKSGSVVGIINLEGVPAKSLQEMRSKLRGDAKIRGSRNKLIQIALEMISEEEDDEEIKKLKEYIKRSSAILVSNKNPFKLHKMLEESKTSAPAKPGAIAPNDIIVPEGGTDFAPGPIVGDLQSVGIAAQIEEGDVVITEDSTVTKEGEEITEEVANILGRLGIEPLEVGLDTFAMYEDGTIYTPDILEVEEEETLTKLENGVTRAMNLSVNASYPTDKNIDHLIQKAFTEMKNLSIESDFITDATLEEIINKSVNSMYSLAENLDEDSLDKELKERINSNQNKSEQTEKEVEPEKEENKEEAEEKETEEEEEEEDSLDGMGAMF